MTTPCGVRAVSRRIHDAHTLSCTDPRCREYGADLLTAAAAFMRGGAGLDPIVLAAVIAHTKNQGE